MTYCGARPLGGGVVPEGVLRLHAGEELHPALVVTGRALVLLGLEGDDQVGDDLAAVAHDRHVGDPVLADLGGVDVGVDHLGAGGERVQVAGHPVVEARAQADDQVALLQAGHRGDGAVHARHAEVLRVAVGERAARHQRGHDGDAGELGEQSAAPWTHARGSRRRRRTAPGGATPGSAGSPRGSAWSAAGSPGGSRAGSARSASGTSSAPAAPTWPRRPAPGRAGRWRRGRTPPRRRAGSRRGR